MLNVSKTAGGPGPCQKRRIRRAVRKEKEQSRAKRSAFLLFFLCTFSFVFWHFWFLLPDVRMLGRLLLIN